jgi:hypothetical protein
MIRLFKGTRDSASTRIRGYTFTDGMAGGVLYIQKIADDKALKAAMNSKIPVIYDYDDNIRDKPGKRMKSMMRLADAVTVDTEERAIEAMEYSNNVFVVPDCIDYISAPIPPHRVKDMKNIVTFGNKVSVKAANGWATHHICSEKVIDGKFIRWGLGSFVSELRKFGACVLRHNEKNYQKSNNRLITAMAIGVPCVVSGTPEMKRTMEEAGYPELIVRDIANLNSAIKFIESHPELSEKCSAYAWKNYSPQKSRESLRKVIESVCK